jgi:prolyl-tRNA editing enzyme YbaK/EbsC (Cys-tRNA(Pro) deacylase)/uncharacterized OsmC-like protein
MESHTRYVDGKKFETEIGRHRILTDQPVSQGGTNAGPSPPELLLASLGACAGHYAEEYLRTRSLPSRGLEVHVDAQKGTQPARLASFHISVTIPEIDEKHRLGVLRSVKACLIHNTLLTSPLIEVEVSAARDLCLNRYMNMLQRILTYLKQHGISYDHVTHSLGDTPSEAAPAQRMRPQIWAQVVVYLGDDGYGMLILAADYTVELGEVKRLLGFRHIRLATASELTALIPDCEIGATPPFGNLFDLPVLMDESIASAEFMAFSVGTPRDAIRMSVLDFHNLVNPLVASFAVESRRALAC